MKSTTGRENDLDVLASLAEPLRRSFYGFVAASTSSVSRDEAADAVGVSRQVAAYHLDRLADDGLLDVEFRRLTGRVGPGAGRPSKLYRRSEMTYDVTIPPRRYELAARILLEAAGEGDLDSSVITEVARRTGREIGTDGLDTALARTGFEPTVEGGETRFRNCPFHVLRHQDLATTCAMNLALVQGMIEGSGADVVASLAPEDGYCCVRLSPDPTV
ncbi:MAG: helix-turn-helix domain-containing protein [Acidimicrobiia bacterium]